MDSHPRPPGDGERSAEVQNMNRFCRRSAICLLAVLLVGYIATYLLLTRQAMAKSEQYGLSGYFFVFPPENTDEWRAAESPYRLLFMPLIMLEYQFGSKTLPGHPPCFTFE